MNAFSLILGAGVALGLLWVAWQSPPKQALQVTDECLAILLGSLVGGRAAYVAVNWAYFQTHTIEAIQIWSGGLSGPGALAGGLLSVLVVAGVTRQPVGVVADRTLPLVAAVCVSAWLACWVGRCAYGLPVNTLWAGLPAADEWGIITRRSPVQLSGALTTLGWFGLLEWGRWRHSGRHPGWLSIPGRPASLGLLGVSLQLYALSFWRADPAPSWADLRLDAWAGLAFAALAVIAFALTWLPAGTHSQAQRSSNH